MKPIIIPEEQQNEIKNKYLNGTLITTLMREYNISSWIAHKIINSFNIHMNRTGTTRKYTLNQSFFDKLDSPTKAEVLGFIYADGYNYEKRGVVSITLSIVDTSYLIKLQQIFNTNRPLRNRIAPTTFPNSKPGISLILSSRHLSQSLSKLGCCQKKSLILKFPEESVLPEHLIKFFILGLFDGDGCICYGKYGNRRPVFRFSICGTNHVCTAIKQYIKRVLNINCNVRPTGRIFVLSCSGNKQVECLLNWLYQDAPFYLERKYNKYLQLKALNTVPFNSASNFHHKAFPKYNTPDIPNLELLAPPC